MIYYAILYYTVLYFSILYYTILYYTILYYTILYYTILYYTILYYTLRLNHIILHYMIGQRKLLRPISLPRLSLLRLLDSNLWEMPHGREFNPLTSRFCLPQTLRSPESRFGELAVGTWMSRGCWLRQNNLRWSTLWYTTIIVYYIVLYYVIDFQGVEFLGPRGISHRFRLRYYEVADSRFADCAAAPGCSEATKQTWGMWSQDLTKTDIILGVKLD